MPTWFLIAAVIALGILGWNLYRRMGADRIAKFMERRRTTARMVSRGEFVDGNRHLAVALAVTDSTGNNVSILLGNGNGTFQTPMPFATGSGPNSGGGRR